MDLRSKMFFPPVAGQWLPDGVSSRVSSTGLQVNTISSSSFFIHLDFDHPDPDPCAA